MSVGLKHGKAKVVRSKPFQIQLLYKEVERYTTPEKKKIVAGIDLGRVNIGCVALTLEATFFIPRMSKREIKIFPNSWQKEGKADRKGEDVEDKGKSDVP